MDSPSRTKTPAGRCIGTFLEELEGLAGLLPRNLDITVRDSGRRG
jgi:hypothetical protein